ncbi:hypothetical protein WMY93_005720 [Mugilogobius chulae]|uniref:Uncharacterized protein n=1 Tax=Mugilogobius chulae TaxID=88201 RepID=A0AAW0PHJ7_9GOBI
MAQSGIVWERTMGKEVTELKRRNDAMMKICVEGGHSVDASSIHSADLQPWQPVGERCIVGYNLKSNIDKQYEELCRKMLTPELQYMSDFGLICGSLSSGVLREKLLDGYLSNHPDNHPKTVFCHKETIVLSLQREVTIVTLVSL